MSRRPGSLLLLSSLILVQLCLTTTSQDEEMDPEDSGDPVLSVTPRKDRDSNGSNPSGQIDSWANLSIEELMKLELAEYPVRDPLSIAVPMSVIYGLILISGLLGNVIVIVIVLVIPYMQSATNYYLFSLALSDLLLLISGVPQEIYHIWIKYPYVFGEAVCVIRGLAAETSANATVLTITAFTVERFVAIVFPLKGHLLSQLSRVVRWVILIWVVAFCMALPQAAQFGILDAMSRHDPERVLIKGAWCALVREIFPYGFYVSTTVFFIIPMTLITVLYILIGLKLRRSRKGPLPVALNPDTGPNPRSQQTHVIRMLVAVVVGFFICWAPFHAQRLMALYATSVGRENLSSLFVALYRGLMHISGILYYLSTCINPILYHIMSNKFRQAFKDTLALFCGQGDSDPRLPRRNYSTMSHRSCRLGYLSHYKSGSNQSLTLAGVGVGPVTNANANATNGRPPQHQIQNSASSQLLETIEEQDSKGNKEDFSNHKSDSPVISIKRGRY